MTTGMGLSLVKEAGHSVGTVSVSCWVFLPPGHKFSYFGTSFLDFLFLKKRWTAFAP